MMIVGTDLGLAFGHWFELAKTLKIAKITYVTKIEIFSKIFFEKKIFSAKNVLKCVFNIRKKKKNFRTHLTISMGLYMDICLKNQK